jgi:tetratricopeptide (TPR) repeat protein
MHFRARTLPDESSKRLLLAASFLLSMFFASAVESSAADIAQAKKLFLSGQYEASAHMAREGEQKIRPRRDEDLPILLSRNLLILGQYAEAQSAISDALPRFPTSIRVRLAAHEVFRQTGQRERAARMLDEIHELASSRSWAFRDSTNLVALGQVALLRGADARRVLDNIFLRVKKLDADYRETYIAIGQLALAKYDYDLAAKTFQEALDKFPDDPELLYGLAKAHSAGDRSRMIEPLEAALRINERHLPSLLLLADHLIDAEEYEKAEELLAKVLRVNAVQPEAWAYRAVLAHLRHDLAQEKKARATALTSWRTNPHVDHLIGQKLSQKYRFAEGADYQRQALRADNEYLPAKLQLAQDLLRLGDTEEGWELAEEVHQQDGYDVLAYNLVTLRDTIKKFHALTNQHFRVLMSQHESAIYGERVTNLLQRAKDRLGQKYGVELERPTVVEIFPEQKDFAVRTFGMPGGEGFLGVCFGHVITANSPASHTARHVNWEAVLWHEFAHVITLGITKNKMPRWLSEGISVYEEQQANPAWGQSMNPKYREIILKGEMTPVASLSSAFLTPKTPFHLQFAYYQSSLVVEFLIDRYGIGALRKILHDLGHGKEINQAIADHTAPLARIEKDFTSYARERARELAPGLDWNEPSPADLSGDGEKFMARHPKSIWTLTQRAKRLLAEQKWEEAKEPSQTLIALYPEHIGRDNPYSLLAQAHRGLNETEQERAVLTRWARLDSEALEAYQRLMELDSAAEDWKAVLRNVERFLAVNPLVPLPYRYLSRATEELGRAPEAIQAYRTLLRLDPPAPADLHYKLARLLHQQHDPSARRHVLQALEEAPRYRDAHRLLLELSRDRTQVAPAPHEP